MRLQVLRGSLLAAALGIGFAGAAPAAEIIDGFPHPAVAFGASSVQETSAVVGVRDAYQATGSAEPLRSFLDTNPSSAWRLSLLTNQGLIYQRQGYYSRALQALEGADALDAPVENTEQRAAADGSIGALLDLHAKLGHAAEIEKILRALGDRPLTGAASEQAVRARETLWQARNTPRTANLCGVGALAQLLRQRRSADQVALRKLDAVHGGHKGLSLVRLEQIAQSVNLDLRAVHRGPAQDVPVPSVVHWRSGHYAAILSEEDGRYLVSDAVLGAGSHWIDRRAIDEEASGYFLAANGRRVAQAEARTIVGAGATTSSYPLATSSDDSVDAGSCGTSTCRGMPQYSVVSMVVSLRIEDTPVGYTPPKGPAMNFSLTYNQREATQLPTLTFGNVGQKWLHSWYSFVNDDPASPGNSVSVNFTGGGAYVYSGFNSTTGAFTPENLHGGAVLVRTSASPIVYERRFPDGRVDVYRSSDGRTAFPRKVFLTERRDAIGNAATLQYDSQMRLTTVTDALGQVTTFTYAHATDPLKLTKVTDPFGRTADIGYDSSGRLNSITDALAMQSTFQYDAGNFINRMDTPYGATTFASTESGVNRSLEITDPKGQTERVEFRHAAPGISYSESVTPTGMNIFNEWINYRDVYYWDKTVYPLARSLDGSGNPVFDYTKARSKHFLHRPASTETGPTLESVKYPLENRIWYNYPGQSASGSGPAYEGTLNRPTAIGRVLPDGTTQLTRNTYNSTGNLTQTIDPLGRETDFEYFVNGIDLKTVKQKTASGFDVLAQYTYNSQHLPLTYTDAAGQLTQYTYNTAGQLQTVTNAKGEVTTLEYDSSGYLKKVYNAAGQTQHSYSYDAVGRIATETDSEGYVLGYAYDNLDRLLSTTYPDTTVRSQTWDKLDIATQTDRQNRTTVYAHDEVRNLLTVTDPLNRVIEYGYFKNGQLKTLKDAKGNLSQWARDLEGRVTQKTFQDTTTVQYGYDTANRLTSVQDALGQTRQFAYFGDDRLKSISYVGAVNPTASVSFIDDTIYPRRVSMTDGSGTTSYAYKSVGSLGATQFASETAPGSNTQIQYGYDELGRMITRTVDSGSSESWSYDNLGRVGNNSNPLGTFTYAYLGKSGQVTSQVLTPPAGLLPPQPGLNYLVNYTYGANVDDRRLRKIQHTGMVPDLAGSQTYLSEPETGITQRTDATVADVPIVQQVYGYDAAYRLTDITRSAPAITPLPTQQTYTQDDADNLTGVQEGSYSFSATANGNNQLQTVNGFTNQFDLNGNLTEDARSTYLWDAENRLIQITGKTNGKISLFKYDGLSRRIAIIEQSGDTPTAETRYRWCTDRLCQIRDASDAVTDHYYAQGEIHGTQIAYYARDHLGSVVASVDAQGNPLATAEYSAFGRMLSSFGTQADFGYAGMFRHQASGLYLTQYRAYDPNAGRWLSRDPIGEQGGINLYAYVDGNPVNSVDPLGLWSTAAHNYIIEHALRGVSPALIEQVKAGSATADSVLRGFQGPDFSFMHGMSSKTLSKGEACEKMQGFVNSYLDAYDYWRDKGDLNLAYFSLGMALHPIMDSTSPAHAGVQKWSSSQSLWHGAFPTSKEDLSTIRARTDLLLKTKALIYGAMQSGAAPATCGCQ